MERIFFEQQTQFRRNPSITPSPPLSPLTKGKIFFAFLDVSDNLKKKVEFDHRRDNVTLHR